MGVFLNRDINHFNNFPKNLVYQIFSFLSPVEVLTVSAACKIFAEISNSNLLWRHYLERDFPKSKFSYPDNSLDSQQIVDYKEKYIQCIHQKNMNLSHVISTFGYYHLEILKSSNLMSSLSHYQNLRADLLNSYWMWIGQDYCKLGQVFSISSQLSFDNNSPDHLPFVKIQEEHQEAVFLLLKQSVEMTRGLTLHYPQDLSTGKRLNSLQKELLQKVFHDLSFPIELALSNAGIQNEDLSFFCHFIEAGKISKLCLDENLIDDEGLKVLLASAKTASSKLTFLTLYGNPLKNRLEQDKRFDLKE